MRADRLISIMMLLQVHRRMTAHDLSKRLEVSERTIHRDMEALSTAGIPVTAERGVNGGWSLVENYRTNLTGLNETEIQALFLTKPTRLLDDLGLTRASEAGFVKLLAALPSTHRRDAEFARQRIYVDVTGWQRSEEAVPLLPALQAALWQENKLQLAYQRNDGNVVARLVDPLGLVARGSVWYFVAAVDGEIRTYRVSRVRNVTPTDQPCVRPSNFDLAMYWEQSKVDFRANLPRYPVLVRIAPEMIERIRYSARYARIDKIESDGTTDADGLQHVRIMFEVDWEAREFLLGLGSRVEILEPVELREQVIQMAQSVVDFYTRHSNPSGAPLGRGAPEGSRI